MSMYFLKCQATKKVLMMMMMIDGRPTTQQTKKLAQHK